MYMSSYFDFMATRPILPEVKAEMLKYMDESGIFANPSATHAMGLDAKAVVDHATANAADCLGTNANNLVWTSGATESNNIAILGIAKQYGRQGKHIITVATEHKAVLNPCKHLENQGFTITKLNVNKNGTIDLNELTTAIRPDTILISVMLVNNETGVIQPLEEICKIAHSKGIFVHTDAAQAVGKIPVNLSKLGVDLASFSAHKVYGPKGIGLLYISD